MNKSNSQLTSKHNTVLIILTIAGIAVITESIILGWEFWVPPIIAGMLVGIWIAHILKLRQERLRENYYLIFGMALAFYHGVHRSVFFDVLAISVVLMTTAALIGRKQFLAFMLWEFFVIMGVQLALENKYSVPVFDAETISRILLHVAGEVSCYIVLKQIISHESENIELLRNKDASNNDQRNDADDMLLRISTKLSECDDNEISGRIIHDLGEYARIRKNNIEVTDEEYSVVSLIDDVVSSGGRYTQKANTALIVDLDPAVPARLCGDRNKLLLIMEHLLDNALNFTKRGCVCLRVTGIKHDDSFNLIIEVTDTGIGMDTSVIEDIAAGSQKAGIVNEEAGGIGLGLSIVYGYVRSMNGFVSADSEMNRGTTVRISVHQEVIDSAPCMEIDNGTFLNVVYHFDPTIRRHPALQDCFKQIMNNTAAALRFNLYYASSVKELNRFLGRGNVTNVFTGKKEYEADRAVFDKISDGVSLKVFDSMSDILYTKDIFEVLNSPSAKSGRS